MNRLVIFSFINGDPCNDMLWNGITKGIFKKSPESRVCNIGLGTISGGLWGFAIGIVNYFAVCP